MRSKLLALLLGLVLGRHFFMRSLWLALWIVLPALADAASYVQSKSEDAGSVGSKTMAFTSNVTAHSTLVLHARIGSGTGSFTAVSDNVNGAWTLAKRQAHVSDGETGEIWYFLNSGAGTTTVSVTLNASASLRWSIMEGALGSSGGTLDKTASQPQDATSNLDSGNVTTTVANEWLIGGFTVGGAPNWTAGASFTMRQTPANKAGMEERDVTSTGTYSATATIDSADNDTSIIATFYAASAPSPATLSSPTPSGTLGTSTTATLGATTDTTSGNFYSVVDTSGSLSGVTAAQIKAGQKASGAAAAFSCNAAVSTTTPSCGVTGLTASTGYAYASVQNSAGGDSNVVTGTFTTGSTSTAVPLFTHHLEQQTLQ